MRAPNTRAALGPAALYYASHFGWAVFPLHSADAAGVCSCGRPDCGNAGKHPRTDNGFKSATRDAGQIQKWWAEWPDANIGIATGRMSNIVVLDVDPRNGGDATLAALTDEHGALPATPVANTGGGGLHYLFRCPPAGAKGRKLKGGLDWKADGGYVVAAPSSHASGRAYAWAAEARPGEVPFADPPAWLIAAMAPPKRAPKAPAGPGDVSITDRIRRASGYLRALPAAVSGQSGHDALWAAALALVRGFDLPENVALELLTREYNGRCQPPWAAWELDHKVQDAAAADLAAGYLIADPKRDWQPPPPPPPRAPPPHPSDPIGPSDSDSKDDAPPSTVEVVEDDWRARLLFRQTRNGSQLDECAANAITILRFDPAWRGIIVFDDFQQSIVCRTSPPWEGTDAPTPTTSNVWSAADTVRAQAWFRRRWNLSLSLEAVRSAVLVASEASRINPVKEWLAERLWDGRLRIGRPAADGDPGQESWLTTYLGAPDSPYTRAVGRWYLISAIARVMQPGCKVDTVPCFEGPQGSKKSTALRTLYSPWFSDTPLELATKDRFVALRGVWGYELAEFDQYSKHDAAALKAFVSSPRDDYRPPYGETNVKVERRCVFAATLNPGRAYISDETGGRRWWPIRTGHVDIDALARDRELLWAEARELYTGGERWWPDRTDEHELCREEQEDRQARDAWEERVSAYVVGKTSVRISEILGSAIGLEIAKWDDRAAQRAGRCLRALQWVRLRDTAPDANGKRGWYYRRGT